MTHDVARVPRRAGTVPSGVRRATWRSGARAGPLRLAVRRRLAVLPGPAAPQAPGRRRRRPCRWRVVGVAALLAVRRRVHLRSSPGGGPARLHAGRPRRRAAVLARRSWPGWRCSPGRAAAGGDTRWPGWSTSAVTAAMTLPPRQALASSPAASRSSSSCPASCPAGRRRRRLRARAAARPASPASASARCSSATAQLARAREQLVDLAVEPGAGADGPRRARHPRPLADRDHGEGRAGRPAAGDGAARSGGRPGARRGRRRRAAGPRGAGRRPRDGLGHPGGVADRRAGRRASALAAAGIPRTCPAPWTTCPPGTASCSRGRCARGSPTWCGTRARPGAASG